MPEQLEKLLLIAQINNFCHTTLSTFQRTLRNLRFTCPDVIFGSHSTCGTLKIGPFDPFDYAQGRLRSGKALIGFDQSGNSLANNAGLTDWVCFHQVSN